MVSGCTDDNAPVGLQSSDPIPLARQNTASRNSSSNPADYTIQLTVDGTTWTYLITKKPGAKDLSNFVKFDDLPAASSYTIVFELNSRFGNFVGTTAWLKAGNSCFAYPVLAPCCPY